MSGYDVESQRTLATVVEALSELPLQGMTASALQTRTGVSRDRIYRTLATLETVGWAQRSPSGAYRLAPRLTQIAERVRQALAEEFRAHLGVGGARG